MLCYLGQGSLKCSMKIIMHITCKFMSLFDIHLEHVYHFFLKKCAKLNLEISYIRNRLCNRILKKKNRKKLCLIGFISKTLDQITHVN